MVGAAVAAAVIVVPGAAVAAGNHPATHALREVRRVATRPAGVSRPVAVAFAPGTNVFYVVPARGSAGDESAALAVLDVFGDPRPPAASGPVAGLAVASDPDRRRLVLFDDRTNDVTVVGVDGPGVAEAPVTSHVGDLGTVEAAGIAVDSSSRTLFVLDRRHARVAAVPESGWTGNAAAGGARGTTWISLAGATADIRGLAFDPASRRFSVLDLASGLVVEYDERGNPVANLDLRQVPLRDPQAIVLAPSGDQTDDPQQTSLYIVDGGTPGEAGSAAIVELAAAEPAASASAAALPSTLVNTIETWRWSPASPDPSGLAYDPTSNRLLVSDGEVDEMSIYAGANYYETTLSGSVVRTTNTLRFTNEPTGVAYDSPARLFITDDDQRRVFEVALGQNGQLDATDAATSFSTSSFGSGDPEGVTYDKAANRLFVADGVNSEIYEIRPVDGVFGNGNDQILHFDTKILGISDPETVELNPDTGTLLTIGADGAKIVEVTTSGSLVSEIDTSQVPLVRPAALAYAPSSTDASKRSIYIADRKVDNDSHPTENDGAIYEVAVGAAGAPPPTGDVRLAAGSDDAEENASGTVNLTSSDLELVTDGTAVQTIGVRFTGLAIPPGATISNAYIQFTVDETQSEATTLTLKAQAADNAPTFTTATANVSSRPRTTASTSWSPPPWTTLGAAGTDQRTPNLAALVQEVVNRPGWANGNALAFIITGSGHRTAVSYNGAAAKAAVLHVEYR